MLRSGVPSIKREKKTERQYIRRLPCKQNREKGKTDRLNTPYLRPIFRLTFMVRIINSIVDPDGFRNRFFIHIKIDVNRNRVEKYRMEHPEEEQELFQIVNQTYILYFEHGSRSSKKVNYFHDRMRLMIARIFTSKEFEIKLEYEILSCNSSGKKRCDIVVLKNKNPYIVFPVKIIMTNYKQNKNNNWENLTGEIQHMRWHNDGLPEQERLHIIPINIFMDKTPYLKDDKTIKHFETVTESDIEIYNKLVTRGLCHDVINYIVEVNHNKIVNERFDEIQPIVRMKTKYRTVHSILTKLL